jgi:hypothetical protein
MAHFEGAHGSIAGVFLRSHYRFASLPQCGSGISTGARPDWNYLFTAAVLVV